MEIEFDPAKDAANLFKHHVEFTEAAKVFLDPHRLDRVDDRMDYGEERRICMGEIPLGGRIFIVAYTVRSFANRIISARKANERECRKYHEAQQRNAE